MPERGSFSRQRAFTNIFNFRDLGGYRTDDGRTVRWQRLYRSDDLSRLQTQDAQRFAELGIRTVIDLRRPLEIEEEGRIPALCEFDYHHIQLRYPPWPPADFADTAQRVAYVAQRYREMREEAGRDIGQVLRLIADAQAAPLVFHCLAGKDRTGVVAALALSLLGVPDEDVAADYALSESAEARSWSFINRYRPALVDSRWMHITVSPAQAMLDFLGEIRDKYGSVTAFAASVGVTDQHLESMRAHLLD
jgi:protein-tyrosine phosphatase